MKVAYLHGEGDHVLQVDVLECILLMMIPVICRRNYFNQAPRAHVQGILLILRN